MKKRVVRGVVETESESEFRWVEIRTRTGRVIHAICDSLNLKVVKREMFRNVS